MINIIYTVVLFNILIVIFKLFERYNVDILQGLIINYLTAAICSYIYINDKIILKDIINADWIYHAIILGSLFVFIFHLFGYAIQKVGILIATLANKMSLMIPVSASIILYPGDTLTITKSLTFILAMIGIYLSSTNKGRLKFNKKYLWLVLFIFFSQGIADAIFSDFEQTFPKKDQYTFYMTLFIASTLTGIVMLSIKSMTLSNKLQIKSLFWGIFFGITNFYSLIFFIKSLGEINNSIVFTLTSVGIVIISSLLGMIVFKERITKRNGAGILFCIITIYIFY